MSYTVIVIEDHPAVREGIRLVLEREGFVVPAGAGSADAGFQAVVEQCPDVVLIDLELPDQSGVELARRLLRRGERPSILLYTGTDDLALLEEGFESGAQGIALKTSAAEVVLAAVHAVAAGGSFIDPEVRRRLEDRADAPVERVLSVREREVLGRLADGRSIEEIAEELVLSVETVRTHVRNAMGKLGTRTRAHAIVVALRRGELAL